MSLEIREDQSSSGSLITVEGEVDLYTSPELRISIKKTLEDGTGPVAVNLSGVRYMDSSGVATLIEGLRLAREKCRPYHLVAPSRPVTKVMELARLDMVFDIREVWQQEA
jgi:anti-sigma B factor antagonist